MADLVLTENITVDGVIDATQGWFDPTTDDPADVADMTAVVQEHMEAQGAILLGRLTFEAFRGYWPQQAGGDETGVSAHLDAVDKFVVSATLGDDDTGWEPTTVLRGDPVAAVTALKAERDGEIGVTGSIRLVRALVAAGLVDEYRLFVYPVVLGEGTRLWPDGAALPALRLTGSQAFRNGVQLLTYRAR